MPSANPNASTSASRRSESPRTRATAPSCSAGPTTRTRSPSWSTKSSVATRSSSPRRTRVAVTPKRAGEVEVGAAAGRRAVGWTPRHAGSRASCDRERGAGRCGRPGRGRSAPTADSGPSDHDPVARGQPVLVGRDADHAVVLDAAEPDAGILGTQLGERRLESLVTSTVQLTIRSARGGGGGGSSLAGSGSRRPSSSVMTTSIDDDRRRVGERIRHDRIPGGHRLAGGLERRRVRRAPGEQPGPVGGRQAEHLSGQRAQPAEHDDQRGGHGDGLAPRHAASRQRTSALTPTRRCT